jgi:hypothetical protein
MKKMVNTKLSSDFSLFLQYIYCMNSEGQEKYLREPSITPVGYFMGDIKNHSRAVSHRNYFACRK